MGQNLCHEGLRLELPETHAGGKGAITRRRILDGAIRRFAMASYDDVSLRDIAADVGVDVAYVHRSFGSKEKLFLAVLSDMSEGRDITDLPLADILRNFSRQVFDDTARWREEDEEPLMILIRSLSLPAAAGPVGSRLDDLFIKPLGEKIGDETGLRASMAMAMLIGLRMMRSFLKLPAMTGADPEQAAEIVRLALERIMTIETPSMPENPGQTDAKT